METYKPPRAFHPRPEEIPDQLRKDAEQVCLLVKLLREKALKTMWAFHAAGFTFPHEIDVLLTDIERKSDGLYLYLRIENYPSRLISTNASDNTGRNSSQTDTVKVNSEDRREETK